MIVTFDTAPVDLTAGDDGGRTIRGVAVPWDQVGTVSDGTRVRFAPGALDASSRPVVTLGHDGPPIGRTADNVDTGTGMHTAVRVSKVRDGDEALTLAADGVLGMFSVGVNPTEWDFDDDVMVVTAADWHHTALLPFGAFASAVVTDVAASQPNPAITGGSPAMYELDTVAASAELDTVENVAQLAAAMAPAPPPGPRPVPVSAAPRPVRPALTLQRFASMIAAANRGEIDTAAVRATIQAALTDVTTTHVAELVQPAYRAEINGLIDHGTPLLRALSNAPLPGSGMSIEYPEWVTKPTVGVQATEKTQITSTAVDMTMKSAPIVTVAGGNDISLQAVERSSPSFLEAYLRAMAVDWGRKADTAAATALLAIANVATPGTAFLSNVQALFNALDPATTPPGPLFLAMSYDVGIQQIGIQSNDGPAFWDGHISFGGMIPEQSGGGLNMFIDWNLPVRTMLLGSSKGATWHQSAGAPADIRVVDVSLLGLDVGVYGYTCLTIEYPDAFAKLTIAP